MANQEVKETRDQNNVADPNLVINYLVDRVAMLERDNAILNAIIQQNSNREAGQQNKKEVKENE